MVREGASDLHLKVGRPPTLRLHGDLVPLNMPALRPEELRTSGRAPAAAGATREFVEMREADFAINVPGIGRFRVNVYQQKGTVAFAMRSILHAAASIRELNLPTVLEQIALKPRGLVLVTGSLARARARRSPRWCSTSTTVARPTSSRSRTRSSSCTVM
jgi:twitching motility protein PilT